jgi:hypothetical protein
VNSTQCNGTGIIICQAGKCQCDAPSYKPCKSSCGNELKKKKSLFYLKKFDFLIEINGGFAYQGDDCRVEQNCIRNAICREEKCQCMENYMVKNGVCCMLKI